MVQNGIAIEKKNTKQSSRYNVSKLLFLGLVFHLVFIGSVFDCYFTSPVVNGMKSFNVGSAPAKRLVLVVGDGLRADLLFNVNAFPDIEGSPRIVAPYLRSIAEKRGAFGISHTRVPTESRPGHVAIIAGMYEDVSAVTKGWKTNPVDFDSVFNQSSSTYSFGSPDILPMFAKGSTPGKVNTWSYHEDDEDFTKDATALDLWVFDHVEELFRNATRDPDLNADLRRDKVVIFLHLLGLDTTGHSYRPHSKEYMHNIQVVDDIVRRAEKLLHEFYGDEDTSFIFTADHGMSVIGNHGDGHPDNTRTPLIAWGKGVRGPLPDNSAESHDDYSEPWGLNHLYRRDVEQADITTLMASLIGVDWPVNSVGVLPDADPSRPGYLSLEAGQETIARAAFVNAKMILEQYRVKHDMKKQHTLWYSPFSPLQEKGHTSGEEPGEASLRTIEQLIVNGDWKQAKQRSLELVHNGLQGLHYLQTYDRFLIRTIVTLAYTGWGAFVSMYLFRPVENTSGPASSYRTFVTLLAGMILSVSWIIFALQRSPWTFYIYLAFPVYFWQQFLAHAALSFVSKVARTGRLKLLSWALFVSISTQAMVLGYTHRSIWSVGLVGMGLLWPLSWKSELLSHHRLTLTWMCLCSLTAVFPLLSVDKSEDLFSISIGGLAIILSGFIGLVLVRSETKGDHAWRSIRFTFILQVLLIFIMMLISASSATHLQAKHGLPVLNQTLGWGVLIIASLLPFTGFGNHQTGHSRALKYFLGFGPAFVILSISVEGMFYAAFSACLMGWIAVERRARQLRPVSEANSDGDGSAESSAISKYRFQLDDLRVALFFLFFVQIGFFGTGNVASISSFYLAPVYRLIPIFNPFFMAALLIFKIVIPYVMLGVAFAELNKALQLPPFSLLLVALALVDGMTLTFFFKVQDTGSWLEIGQSISFFCITSLLLLWSAAICALGEYLMADTVPSAIKKE